METNEELENEQDVEEDYIDDDVDVYEKSLRENELFANLGKDNE